jgi:hypothetical protein
VGDVDGISLSKCIGIAVENRKRATKVISQPVLFGLQLRRALAEVGKNVRRQLHGILEPVKAESLDAQV